MEKHSPPAYRAKSFVYPFCNVYAQQDWLALTQFLTAGYEQNKGIGVTKCKQCNELAFWFQGTMIYPIASIAPQPSYDMPEEVAADFNEARLVLAFSSRSSAALLRLALQKLCIYLS